MKSFQSSVPGQVCSHGGLAHSALARQDQDLVLHVRQSIQLFINLIKIFCNDLELQILLDLDILYCRTATPEERLGSGFRPLPYIEDQDLVPHVRQSIKKSNLLNYSGYSGRRTDPVFVEGRIRILSYSIMYIQIYTIYIPPLLYRSQDLWSQAFSDIFIAGILNIYWSVYGTYIRWQLRNRCAHKDLSMFDLFKALELIESNHKSFFFFKNTFFLHTCATCSELPSNISTIGLALFHSEEQSIHEVYIDAKLMLHF